VPQHYNFCDHNIFISLKIAVIFKVETKLLPRPVYTYVHIYIYIILVRKS